MLILALDTSGDTCSLCLSDDDRPRVSYQFRHERRLGERLPGAIDFLLHDANTTLKEVDGFAVGLGPGSFTGVRVGVTMAKTWAFALHKPVVGVSSLDAVADPFRFLPSFARVAVAPTRKTEVIAAFYSGGAGTAEAQIIPHVEVVARAREQFGNLPILLCGEVAPDVLAVTADTTSVYLDATPANATVIARLAFLRLLAGESDDVHRLVPEYVTPTPVG